MKNKILDEIRKDFKYIFTTIIVFLIIITSYYFYNKKQEVLFKNYLSTAEQQFSEENYFKAVNSLTEAIQIKPNEPSTYVLRAWAHYFNNENDEAIKDTDSYLSLNGSKPIKSPSDFFLLRGDLFREASKVDLALEAYRKAYTLGSTIDEDIVGGYAGALNVKGEYEQAFSIIAKYFDEVDKNTYKDNIIILLAGGRSSVMTHRCLNAINSAKRVLTITKTGDGNNKIAQEIIYQAMNDKECVDK